MTGYELADLIAYILVPVIGGLVAWVLKLNNKVIAQCEKIKNIEDTAEKTSNTLTAIKDDLDKININIALVMSHLEIQEVPVRSKDK